MATIRRWTGREASALRQAMRLSIRAFADHLGVAARTVSKWEQHGAATLPLPDTQAILDTALNQADPEAKTRFESLLNSAMDEDPDEVQRRTMLGLLVITASPLAGRLEDLRRALDGALVSQSSGRDADDWEQTVGDYARDVGILPAAQLLPDLIVDVTEIHTRITETSGLIRTRMIHSASQLAALTAIACVTLGELRAAHRWWRTAARAAGESTDPELVSLIRGRQAVFSLGIAQGERVLDLADRAIGLNHAKPWVGVISGLAARAQGLAQLGRHGEAAAALRSVIDTYGRLPSTAAIHDSTGQWNWSEQRLRHVQSYVHAHAGQVNEASHAQDAALALYPTANYQGRSQVEFHRSAALIRSGDVDTGARHLTATLEQLRPWQREDGIVLRSVMTTLDMVPLRQRHLPSVEQVRELLASTGEQ